MVEALVQQFLGSDKASSLIADVASQAGVDTATAQSAVAATAEGAAQHLSGQADGGVAGALGGLLGGNAGGLLSMATGMLGGGGASTAISPAMIETVSNFVAQKTGLAPATASTIVQAALPKVLAEVQSLLG